MVAVFFAITLSIDALGVGFSTGLRGVRPTFLTYAVVFSVSLLVMAASVFFGNMLKLLIAPQTAEIVAGVWIFALGLWIALGAIKAKRDEARQEKAGLAGAFALSLMLSIDSMGAGLAAAALGVAIAFLPIYVAAFQTAFLALGVLAAAKLPVKRGAKLPTIASGVILMALGAFQLI